MYIIAYMGVYVGVMIVLEGYRDGGIVGSVESSVLYAFSALIYFC